MRHGNVFTITSLRYLTIIYDTFGVIFVLRPASCVLRRDTVKNQLWHEHVFCVPVENTVLGYDPYK